MEGLNPHMSNQDPLACVLWPPVIELEDNARTNIEFDVSHSAANRVVAGRHGTRLSDTVRPVLLVNDDRAAVPSLVVENYKISPSFDGSNEPRKSLPPDPTQLSTVAKSNKLAQSMADGRPIFPSGDYVVRITFPTTAFTRD
jgi:hypothetical protein